MEQRDRLRMIAQAANDEGIFDGGGSFWELHHLLVLDETIELPLLDENEDLYPEVIETRIIGAPYGERKAWAFVLEDGVDIYPVSLEGVYETDQPLYMQTAEIGGTNYDARAVLGEYVEDDR